MPQDNPVQDDAFRDPDFTERLVKLLAMLSTEHPAEADTARRKLLAHLQARGLSLADLVRRVQFSPAPPGRRGAEPFEDQGDLREARELADRRYHDMLQENRRLVRLAATAEAEARALRRKVGALRAAVLGVAAVAVGFLVIAIEIAFPAYLASGDPIRMAESIPPRVQPWAEAAAAALPPPSSSPRRRPGEAGTGEVGVIVAKQASLLTTADHTAPVRATLPHGARVLVVRTLEEDGLIWSEVRSAQGPGYVAATEIGSGWR